VVPQQAPILEVRALTKTFPGVVALAEVRLDVLPGEVHVLLGENGAGKSTLMKALAGVHRPDSGEILLRGQPVTIDSPLKAFELGISTIYQEFNLIPDLSVAENLFFGREPAKLGLVDKRKLREMAKAQLAEVGLALDPATPVRNLGVAQCQMVEIAKALSFMEGKENGILTLDEPTAALSDREIARLFALIKALRTRGISMIYISHRLQEIREIGDRATVMRDGKTVGTFRLAEVTTDDLIRHMVGREVSEIYPTRTPAPGAELLRVEGLESPKVKGVSFAVRAGEIVGIAGLVGAGRTEVLRLIFGADRATAGRVLVDGKPVRIRSPRAAVKAGIGLLPEDRKGQGLALPMSIRKNVSAASLERFVRFGFIARDREAARAQELSKDLAIRTPSIDQLCRNLSGGNQQKVVLAKWLCRDARVIMFDEPTRGIDVGARSEVYKLMATLAEQGKAILMVSSDLPEVLGMSDRILVMADGALKGELRRDQATQEKILALATPG